jgi:hypothetical protein
VIKNLQSAIVPVPPLAADAPAPDPAAVAAAALADEQAKAYLLSNMDDIRMQQSLQYATARELWEGLRAAYQRGLPARRNALVRELHDLELGSMNINQYIDTLKAIVADLKGMEHPTSDAELQRLILYGLRHNKDYATIVLVIEAINAEPNINEVQMRLSDAEMKIKEQRASGRAAQRDSQAYFAGNTSNNRNTGERKPATEHTRCYNCNKFGHYSSDCTSPRQNGRRNDSNRRNNGQPRRDNRNNRSNNQQPRTLAFVTLGAKQTQASSDVLDCIMDSGASTHIVNNLDYLSDYRALSAGEQPPTVLGINGQAGVAILGFGTAYIETDKPLDGLKVEGKVTLKLEDVCYCPGANANLLSVGRITAAGAGYHQGPQFANIASGDPSTSCWSAILTTSRRLENMFTVPLRRMNQSANLAAPAAAATEPAAAAAATTAAAAGRLAHQKSGHVGYGNLIRAVRLGQAPGLGANEGQLKAASLTPCIPCLTGKATRTPAPPSAVRSVEPLGRIHADLMGPLPKPTLGGGHYGLLLYCDNTRYSVASVLKSKAEVPGKVISILTRLSTQTGRPVKVLRTDHGSEFDNSTINDFCRRSGTMREFSPPYDARLNGRAERLGRTNGERMRTALIDSGLPEELWGEVFMTVNYLRNLLPVSGLDVSPHQALFGSQPDLGKLHPLGCLCVSRNPKPHLSKLKPRGDEGYLVGYEPAGGGYRIYFPSPSTPTTPTKPSRIEVRRDVTFIDNELYGSSRPTVPSLEEEADYKEPGVACSVCKSTSCFVPSSMLLCDTNGCEQGVHMACLTPPLTVEPPDLWFCPACIDQQAIPPLGEEEEEEPPVINPPAAAQPPPPPPAAAQPPPPPPSAAQPPAAPLQVTPAGRSNRGRELTAPGAPRPRTRSVSRAQIPPEPAPIPRPNRIATGDPLGSKQQRINKATLKMAYKDCRAYLVTYPPAPNNLAEAKRSPEWPHWDNAMRSEITSLMQMQTWTLREMPPGTRPITHKWVYVRKLGPDGKVARYKARLVAHGFKQIPGVDFDETFAPVSRHPTIRTMLSHANHHDLEIRQLDVKTAFLNGKLEEETWLVAPEALGPVKPGYACFLHRALYGLRQSPRVWYETIRADLSSIGFETSPADLGLFYCHGQRETVYLVLYVDDCLIIGPKTGVELTAAWMCQKYSCHDLGPASTYLGMQIVRDRSAGTLTIHQAAYTRAIFAKYNLEDCKPRVTPFEHRLTLSRVGQPLPASVPYSSLVGTLLYLSVCTRPDIAYSVGTLTRHLQQPTVEAWEAAKSVVRYLAGSVDLGITYSRSADPSPVVFSDSDFGADETRRSHSGVCVIQSGGAVAWSSRQQQTVAASTVEAELMALAEATKQALWLQKLMHCLPMQVLPMQIYGDNQGTIALVHNEGSSARTKHIAIHHLFTRDRISTGEISVSYISTKEMTADVLTKSLDSAMHYACIQRMGMYPTSG